MVTRRYRHTDICAVLGPNGFERPDRERTRSRSTVSASATSAISGVARAVDAIHALGRRVDATTLKLGRMSDSLDGVAEASSRVADRRAAFRGRV